MPKINARLSRDGGRVLVSVNGGQWRPFYETPFRVGVGEASVGSVSIEPGDNIRFEYRDVQELLNGSVITQAYVEKIFVDGLRVFERDVRVLQASPGRLYDTKPRENSPLEYSDNLSSCG